MALSKADGLQTMPTSIYTYNWASGTQYQLFTGDSNGDGYGDLGLRNTGNGTFYMYKNDNTQNGSTWNFSDQKAYTWTTGAQYLPIIGDFR